MKWLIYISFIFSNIAIGFSQTPVIAVDFDVAEVGDAVLITVKSPIAGKLELDLPDDFVAGSSTQSGMTQEMNYNTGKVSTVYFYAQNGIFSKAGNYTLRAQISLKGKTYKAKAIKVKVQNQIAASQPISKRNLKQPIFGIVEKSKTKIYEGEPLIVNGKIYSKLKVEVQGYHPFEIVGNAEIINLNHSNDLVFTSELVKGQKFASAQFGKQLLFFNAAGKYQINPFEMSVLYEIEANYAEKSVFTSNGGSIEVLPLPIGAPKNFIGAVGKYQLSRTFDKTKLKQGDIVTMTVVISGYGNLHNINVPEFDLPKGVILYGDPEIVEDFTYGLRGAEGKIAYKYNLQMVQDGKINLEPIAVSYFDPELKKYLTISSDAVEIFSESSSAFQAKLPEADQNSAKQLSTLEPLVATDIDGENNLFIYSNLFWPTVLSPIALAFLGGLFMVRRQKLVVKMSNEPTPKQHKENISQWISEASALAAAGDTQEAFGKIQIALKSTAARILQTDNVHLSKFEIQQGLEEKNVEPGKVKQFVRLLLRCEEARYTFIDQSQIFLHTKVEAEELLKSLT